MRSIVLAMVLVGCGGTGSNNNGVETCTQALCPMGGHTYRYCSAPQATACRYLASDGTIFNCVSCSNCVAAADQVSSWCATGQDSSNNNNGNNNNNNNGNNNLPDLSTRRIADLALPPNGCNGFNTCLNQCGQSNPNNPTGYDNCANGCAAGSTDNGVNLWVQAFFICPAQHFCSKADDAGVIPCTSADLDPNATMVSDSCNQCLNNAYSTMSTTIQTTCSSDINACLQDKP